MVNAKSLANLEKGRKSKHKRNTSKGRKTWQDLIREFGDSRCELAPGKTWREAMIESGFKHAMLGNAAIFRELLQRDEPQDIGVKLNFPALTDEQVNRIADGEDPRTVLASPGAGGT